MKYYVDFCAPDTCHFRTELPDTKRTARVRVEWPERGSSEANGSKSTGRGRNLQFDFKFEFVCAYVYVCVYEGTIAPVLFAADDEGRRGSWFTFLWCREMAPSCTTAQK